jgi:hypothetical protein
MCPSSGEITVSMRHLILVTLCGWLSGMKGGMKSDKYQVLHRYSYFSWWWAHSCLKHVEKRNNHTKKNCAPSWLYLQDYTGTHSQWNNKIEHPQWTYFKDSQGFDPLWGQGIFSSPKPIQCPRHPMGTRALDGVKVVKAWRWLPIPSSAQVMIVMV